VINHQDFRGQKAGLVVDGSGVLGFVREATFDLINQSEAPSGHHASISHLIQDTPTGAMSPRHQSPAQDSRHTFRPKKSVAKVQKSKRTVLQLQATSAKPPTDTSLAGSASGKASTRAALLTGITLRAHAYLQASTTGKLKRPLVIDPDLDTEIGAYEKEARRVFRQRNPAAMKRRGRRPMKPDIEDACEQVWQDLARKRPLTLARWVKRVQEVFDMAGRTAPHEDTVKPVVKAWLLRHIPHDQLPQSLRVPPNSK
jgi:hypothetical protein